MNDSPLYYSLNSPVQEMICFLVYRVNEIEISTALKIKSELNAQHFASFEQNGTKLENIKVEE